MAWIESHTELANHPKVFHLAELMGWSLPETIGRLHLLWWWCLTYAPDGVVGRYSDRQLATACHVCPESTQQFIAALIEAQWLEEGPPRHVHDWWDYAGRFLQVRYKHSPKNWKKIKALYSRFKEPTKNGLTTDKEPTKNGLTTDKEPTYSRFKEPTYSPFKEREKNHKPNLTKPNLTKPNLTKPNLTGPEELNPSGEVAQKHDATLAGAGDQAGTRRRARAPALSAETWQAYAEAYRARYGVAPVRNAQVNAQLAALVRKLGREEAPHVARWYLSHPDRLYVARQHPTSLLLRDAEGLRTQWARGQPVTSTMAAKLDERVATEQMWRSVQWDYECERRHGHDVD